MNDLQGQPTRGHLTPVGATAVAIPKARTRWSPLVLGVIYPAGVIGFELVTRMCAHTVFDPMPTIWHVLAVSFVPAMNAAVWARLPAASLREARWLAFGIGFAAAIAILYAILFLPFVPLALIGIVVYGIGLLPLAPVIAAVCCAAALARVSRTRRYGPLGRYGGAGVAVGLLGLAVIEVPMFATRLGVAMADSTDAARRERGLWLLRTLGDDDLLLGLCYGTLVRPAGPLGMMMLVGEGGLFSRPSRDVLVRPPVAREIYYRVHGAAFNSVRAPPSAGRQADTDDFQFDADLGGAQVGGRVKGLSMTSSRIDGSVAGDDAVGYLEWTFEFHNTSLLDREARLELALPPDAVVSRASLWVNGEEREAAYGGRGEVRAAYQKVAVQQRRDPLLVTTKGADRVLAQAFPVPRNGGTIKFKIGMTVPLKLLDASTGRLVLPAIFDRNFNIGADLTHAIWIDSKTALKTTAAGLSVQDVSATLHRVSGRIDDVGLTRVRPAITVARQPDDVVRLARIGDGVSVIQEIKTQTPTVATGVTSTMIVIDGSGPLGGKAEAIIAALDANVSTGKIGLVIAAEPLVWMAPTQWDRAARTQAAALLRAHRFVGGQDNTQALSDALIALEGVPDSRVLWVHGPQPLAFAAGTARLEQVIARIGGARLPTLTLYPVAAGPNAALPDLPWAWRASMLPSLGSIDREIADFLSQSAPGVPRFAIERRAAFDAEARATSVKGSDHIVRLWARDHVTSMVEAALNLPQRDEQRLAAVAMAGGLSLVTPVSGAVVLETKQQYDESGLTPAAPASVPTVPEPHEWALILIAGLTLIWIMGRTTAATGRVTR